MDTLASARASIVQWLRGSKVDQSQVDDAINDGIESLFQTLIRASLSVLMQGPVNISLAATEEGVTLVSIADPTANIVVSNTPADDATVAAHSVQVAFTYVTDSGSETLASPTVAFTTTLGNVAAVHPPVIAAGAIGWNCYARGSITGYLVKQNDEPLPFNTTSNSYFIEPDTGWTNDPDDPLPPVENTTGDNIFYIRHMEVVTGSGIMKSWNQGDIDGDMMRQAGMTLSCDSEYQSYAFDLINQRQLEIRPAMGSTLTARYFFVVKPRRLRFGNSPLPFPTVPSSEFLRDFALSAIFLSLREIALSEAWSKRAEAARSRCELAITMLNRPKNRRILAYRPS